ncbi:MAG: YeeE/YedE thiosulfate transporter family protein [Bacillota bacterium]
MSQVVFSGSWSPYLVGVYFLRRTIPGGLIFGTGFILPGYCPGTIAGAIGQGSMDALISGFLGIFTGSFFFASFYEKFSDLIDKNKFKVNPFPELLNVNHWKIIIPFSVVIIMFLVGLESVGF